MKGFVRAMVEKLVILGIGWFFLCGFVAGINMLGIFK
jgi:hypothetical protein